MDLNPYRSPRTEPSGDERRGCVVSTSFVETFLLLLLLVFGFSMFTPEMRNSPMIGEWFGWAPVPWRHVLFFATTQPILALPLCLMAFVPDVMLSERLQARFPVTFLRRGSPPFVGAFVRTLWVVLFFFLVGLLASLED